MPRGNPQNLRGSSPEEAREIARRGALKSIEVRRRKKSIMESLRYLLEQQADGDPDGRSNAELIAYAIMKKAQNGDVKAGEYVRDTVGERPGTNINVSGQLGDVEILRIPDNGRIS